MSVPLELSDASDVSDAEFSVTFSPGEALININGAAAAAKEEFVRSLPSLVCMLFISLAAFSQRPAGTMSGTVTDFLEFHASQSYFFPAFNVADSAIFCGACLLLMDMWRSRERKSQPALDS